MSLSDIFYLIVGLLLGILSSSGIAVPVSKTYLDNPLLFFLYRKMYQTMICMNAVDDGVRFALLNFRLCTFYML